MSALNYTLRRTNWLLKNIISSFCAIERLELLGIAAGRVFEPIEAIGYTPEEIEYNKKESFLEEILAQAQE